MFQHEFYGQITHEYVKNKINICVQSVSIDHTPVNFIEKGFSFKLTCIKDTTKFSNQTNGTVKKLRRLDGRSHFLKSILISVRRRALYKEIEKWLNFKAKVF